MAQLNINTRRIIDNIDKLHAFLDKNRIHLSLITKIACGYKPLLDKIISHPIMKKLHSIGDSRISNLRIIKEIHPDIKTMYIKPPAINQVANVIQCADISFNSSYETLKALDNEAQKAGKIHEVIIMIEMGELREGILRDNILAFYERIFDLKSIRVIGLGTNLGCMYGVEPTYDKLMQLSLYKLLIESKFNKKIDLISAGSSIALPMVNKRHIPKDVNHFRVGETVFLGVDLMEGKKFRNLSTTTFDFSAEIVELEKKGNVPDGNITEANIGHTIDFDNVDYEERYKAILDFGLLDVDVEGLTPVDPDIQFFGTTSDMTVYDLGMNKKNYRVGKQVHFRPSYMAIARIMNSRYVTKKIT